MAAQTLTLGGRRFVLLPEGEYRKLSGKGGRKRSKRVPPSAARRQRLEAQDRGDVAEARRRLVEPGENIPWATIKAQRGV